MRTNLERYFAARREKKKTGNIRVTYDELLEQAAGGKEQKLLEIRTGRMREFQQLLEELIREGLIAPVKSSRKRDYTEVIYERYEIIGRKKARMEDTDYLALLHAYVGTKVFDAYRKNRSAFEQDREAIDVIYRYYCTEKKRWMTANELGYYLFADEKAFEQPEVEKEPPVKQKQNSGEEHACGKDGQKSEKEQGKKVGRYTHLLKKMGLDLEQDLQAFYTKEPFACQIRASFFEKKIRRILIVENKDTYFRIKDGAYGNEYDCVIYGEGWKITSAFSLAPETGIMETDVIEYFGDIDPEGFSIYYELKTQYASYQIRLQTEWYQRIWEAVNDQGRIPQKIRGQIQKRAKEVLPLALEEFSPSMAQSLERMMLQEGCYIPQEALILTI